MLGEFAQRAVAAAIAHRARVGRHQARDQMQQRRLARAGFADDRERLALLEFERNVVGRRCDRAVALAEALGAEQRRAHSAASFVCAACRFSQ